MEGLRSSSLTLAGRNIDYLAALLEAQRIGICVDLDDHQCASCEEITQSLSLLLLKAKTKFNIKEIIQLFRELEVKGMINHAAFMSTMSNSLSNLTLDSLLLLIQESVLPTSMLLSKTDFFDIILSSCKSASLHNCVKGITVVILSEAFPECSSCIAQAAKKFLLDVVMACFEGDDWTSEFYSPLHAIDDSKDISIELLNSFHSFLLSEILTMNPTLSVYEAIRLQPDFEFHSLPQSSLTLFSLLGATLDTEVLVSTLKVAIYQQLSWKSVLMFVTCNIHLRPSFQEHFLSMLQEIVGEAMLTSNRDLLSSSVLLARQFKIGSFCYKNWFKQQFGRGKIVNKRNLNFLLETLTSFVPYEPVEYLKIHLEVLSKTEYSHIDYTALVRTRLTDLSAILVGKNEITASKLIKEAIDEFCCSGRILNRVSEISIFNSPFYIGCFLPLLLSASAKEDQIQQALIVELFRQGRIPKKMYLDYEKMTACIAQGDCAHDDTQVIGEAVRALAGGNKPADFHQCLINSISDTSNADYTTISCDFKAPSLLQWQINIVDQIVCGVCQEISDGVPSSCLSWVLSLLKVLNEVHCLLWPLLVRLWELLIRQISALPSLHVQGLACLVAHLGLSTSLFIKVVHILEPPTTLRTFVQFGEMVLENLPLDNQANMKATYQFMVHYLLCCQHLGSTVCVEKVLAMCAYIHCRYSATKRILNSSDLENQVTQLSLDSKQFSYSQWLDWEFRIDPHNDFLFRHERVTYLESTLQLFLSRPNRDGGLGHDMLAAMNQLFLVLLKPSLPSYEYALALFMEILKLNSRDSCVTPLAEAVDFAVQLQSLNEDCLFGNTIIKLLCDIPARYLYAETAQLSVYSNCLSSVQTLRKNCDSFILPLQLSLHLAKGLSRDSVTLQLCCISHLYYSSLLVALAECSSTVAEIHNIPNQLLGKVKSLFDVQSPDLPPQVLAVTMFHMISSCSVTAIIKWLQTATEIVLAYLLDCCARALAASILQPLSGHTKTLMTVTMECIKLKPNLICGVHLDLQYSDHQEFLSLFRDTFPHPGMQLLPLVFFRVLTKVPHDSFMDMLKVSSFAPLCISNHFQLMELEHVTHLHCYQAFDVNFLTKCTSIIKRIIETSTPQNLKVQVQGNCHWTIKHMLATTY